MNDHGVKAVAKGLAFEQRLARLFEAKGYEVVHNASLVGRSGAAHQIDVLARLVSPLHSSTLIVEAKAYESAVDKDRVMKLIQIVNDVGADRGIIVTTSYFTPDALKTAAGHCVDVWDREHLSRLLGEVELNAVEGARAGSTFRVLTRAIEPRVDVNLLRGQLQREVDKRSRGTFGIGKVAETLVEVQTLFYPYYDVEVETSSSDIQRVGLFKKESIRRTLKTRVTFDAAVGVLVEVNAFDRRVSYEYGWLVELTSDELRLLKAVSNQTFVPSRLPIVGLSELRLKRAVTNLHARGILKQVDARPASYRATKFIPADPITVTSLTGVHEVTSDLDSTGARLIQPQKESAAITSAIATYWPDVRVTEVMLVHYPYFCAVYQRLDGSIRTETFDAISGKEHPDINVMVRPSVVVSNTPALGEVVPAAEE